MSEPITSPAPSDFARMGFVDAPLVPPSVESGESHWLRLVGNAAANRLLAACVRARAAKRPVLVKMTEEIPDYYYRVAQNDFLARTTTEPQLGVMALNIPLEMMRLGRIRGTIAELAELVVAVDMPVTLGAWYAANLDEVDPALPEAALVTDDEMTEARELFASDPHTAVQRYLSFDARPLTDAEMDVVVHEAYLRQVGQPVDVEKDEESAEVVAFDPMGTGEDPSEPLVAVKEPMPDENMRECLLALARDRLSPVLAKAFAAYGQFGESVGAQELKITKAPRKTLGSLLRFMNARWSNIVVVYDSFDSWPMLEQVSRVDVLASLTELRYIIGETGVMVVGIKDDLAPEIEEQYAAAEQVDWLLPEVHALSRGEKGFNAEWVQSWFDAASLAGTSRLRVDGPEFAPIVAACGDGLSAFATMADVAIRDAAARGLDALDEAAVAAGLAAKPDEAGA